MEMAAKKKARSGVSSEGTGVQGGAVVPFDYSASAAQNPSISAAFKPELAGLCGAPLLFDTRISFAVRCYSTLSVNCNPACVNAIYSRVVKAA
jgi:hypothetical protein